MTSFQIAAILLTFAAAGGYLNHKFVKLPTTIGHMAFALLLSLAAVALNALGLIDLHPLHVLVSQIDFSKILLHGMLAFLLFAGALHINLDDLKQVKYPVAVLATAGVAIATFITGTLIWLAAGLLGLNLSYIHALLFGALISPTDPIAVLSILKQTGAPKNLYTKIGGESLFNDGVGVVVFTAILGAVSGGAGIDVKEFFVLLVREGVGGIALGMALGWIVYRLLRSVDEYKIEVMMTLALVTGGYALAEKIGVSGPICMVVAGLIIGNHGRDFGMSDTTRGHLDIFWEMIDEILNAVLFLLIGFEIATIPFSPGMAAMAFFVNAAVLAARFVSVALPVGLMKLKRQFDPGTIRLLTWGGLRGGLSIAMALSLPEGPEKSVILQLTYMVVLFSIFVQGLTFGKVAGLVKTD